MHKETYFSMVDELNGYKKLIEGLQEVRSQVVFREDNEEDLSYNDEVREFYEDKLASLNVALAEYRKEIPKETLHKWSQEYRKRPY